MSKQWLNRLALSYLPIFFVISLLLLASTALIVSELSRKASEQANQASVKHAMMLLDNSLQAADGAILKEIQANSVLRQFYYPPPGANSFSTVYEPSNLLHSLISGIQSIRIDSIYLYRISDQSVLTANSLLPLDRFGDREFVERIQQAQPADLWSNERTYKEFVSQEASASVVSLVRQVPPLSGGQGYIVANIRTTDIADMAESIMNSSYSHVSLTDRQGTSLLNRTDRAKTLREGETQGFGLDAAAYRSDYTGWQMQSELYNMGIFNRITGYMKILLIVGGLTILIGTVAIVLVSRRNYRPVESILSRLKTGSPEWKDELKPQAARNEFQLIEAALADMMEKSSQYRARQEEDHLFRRRYFFEELMQGRPVKLHLWREELARLGLEPTFARLQATVVELDFYAQFCRRYSHTDQQLMKYVIGNVVTEIVSDGKGQAWAEWLDANRLTVLHRWPSEAVHEDAARSAGTRLCEWVSDYLPFTVTVGIGPQVEAIEQIGESCQGALQAVAYKTVLGTGRVIAHDEIVRSEPGETYAHLQQIRKLANAYRLGDDGWRQQYEDLFQSVCSMLFSRNDLASLANYMIYHLQREMMELPLEFQIIWKSEAVEALNAAVDQFETADELFGGMQEVLLETAESMKLERGKRSHHAIIQRVREYIECNFANPELSLNHLSDVFGVNPKHVSQLFKDEFGIKFVDYLAQVRVEQAKRLLLESEQTVQEVAARVGYVLPFSFIRVFKKIVGVTPGDYRKECG